MRMIIISTLSILKLLATPQLTRSVWIHTINESCVDTLKILSNGKAVEYSCEQNYSFNASYTQTKDTLIVTVKDDSHSEDGGKIEYYKTRYIIHKNALYILGSGKRSNGKLTRDSLKGNKTIWFKKIL